MTTTISVCPRCEAPLFDFGWEPCCLLCGYADYRYDEDHGGGDSLLSSATTILLRYVGEHAALDELTATLVCRREGQHRLEFFVGCPWCGEEMQVSSIQRKLKDKEEARYKCAAGHLVKLASDDNGSFGWR